MWAYIGSRTTRERQARGEGITVCRVQQNGSLQPIQIVGGLVNPSYLVRNQAGDRLYTVHGDGDACSVLAVDPSSGELRLLQTLACGLRNPVHLALDLQESRLIVASHLSGEVVVLPLDGDGMLQPAVQRVALPGDPGPHRKEQPFSKPHFNLLDPSGRFVVVPDKGLDRIFVFRVESGATGCQLVPASVPVVQAREGAGPRNVVFHPSGNWMAAINELDSTVAAYRFDAATGALTPLQWLPTLPDHFMGNSRAAGIAISAHGHHLYVSNRGFDSIEVFALAPDTGRLQHVQSRHSEGRTPRFFALHPAGHCLYVHNEDSDTVVVMTLDPASGLLGQTISSLAVGSPVCMVFRD
ncbi:MAG: hypothetical protein RLZZ126_1458 [Pseudomonadota bacterium]|jgi:6-phosphogluconolactonase (cycloisomerase 2 family)